MKLPWQQPIKTHFETAAVLFTALTIFGLNISASLTSIAFVLAALCAILSGSPAEWALMADKNRFYYAYFFFLVLCIIGVYNNHFIPNFGWSHVKKYLGPALLAFCISPLFKSASARRAVYYSIVGSALYGTLFLLILVQFHLNDFLHLPIIHMINVIPFSYMLAFALFIVCQSLFENAKYRWPKILVALWFVIYLFGINVERSGMLAGVLLVLIIILQRIPSGYRLPAFTALAALLAVGLQNVPAMHNRFIAAAREVHEFRQNENNPHSITLRLNMAKYSWMLIKQKPLFGHGTGSFSIANDMVHGPVLPGTRYLGDPHNSFIHITVQLGALGLLAILVFFFLQWRATTTLPEFERHLMQGLIITFVVFSCCISALLRQRASVFYWICVAIGFGANLVLSQQKNKQ